MEHISLSGYYPGYFNLTLKGICFQFHTAKYIVLYYVYVGS